MPATDPSPVKRRVGRPTSVGGRYVHVYLDEHSLAVAAALGAGNVSAGIRAALAAAQKNQKTIKGA